jgi:HEAT repeat protein
MIYWHEYKKYKQMAERYLTDEISQNVDIQIEIYKFTLGKITKEQAIENIINALSDGEHFKK